MTSNAAALGTAPSKASSNDTTTSSNSPRAVAITPQPQPSLSPSGGHADIKENKASSLYALGIQAQDIASEIALAAELLGTDDPEEEASAVALIEQYLDAQDHTAALIESKADNICRYIDHLQGLANFRKEQATRLAALAEADFKRAEALKEYMLGVLTRLYPDNKQFSLPTHELRSRKTQAVVVDDEAELPTEYLRRRVTYAPDKTAIKNAIQQGETIPGARLEDRISWAIK